MPAFLDRTIALIEQAATPDEDVILQAVRVGCSDAEIAGMMGISPSTYGRLLLENPGLRARIEALRAGRKFALRAKVQEIALNDRHDGQTRILDRLLVGELLVEDDEEASADSWHAMMNLAKAGEETELEEDGEDLENHDFEPGSGWDAGVDSEDEDLEDGVDLDDLFD